MQTQDLMQPPPCTPELADCRFYHTIDLPQLGVCHGSWDLRRGIDAYLGHVDVRGKRVLDVGAASGFLSFTLERHGAAEVISYDLGANDPWDLLPNALDHAEDCRANLRRVQNSYRLAHALLGSRAQIARGTVYNVAEVVAPVDVAVVGCVLLHVRDPFLALVNVSRVARETIIIAEPVPRRRFPAWLLARCSGGRVLRPLGTQQRFLRAVDDAWWYLPPQLLSDYLHVLGFTVERVLLHTQQFEGARRLLYSLVARRVAATAGEVERRNMLDSAVQYSRHAVVLA